MNNRRRAGFTAAELLLVIILLAMVAALGARHYGGTYKQASLRAAARSLMTTARYGRFHAVEHAQRCQLVLDRGAGRFFLTVPSDDQDAPDQQDTMIRNAYSRPVILADGLTFEAVRIEPLGDDQARQWTADEQICFYPDGRCDAAVVQLGNGHQRMTAVFSSACGRVTIHQGSAETVSTDLQVVDLDAPQ